MTRSRTLLSAALPVFGLLLTACGAAPIGPGAADVPMTCQVVGQIAHSDFKSEMSCRLITYDAFAEQISVEPDGNVWQANSFPARWLDTAGDGARINLAFRGDDRPPLDGRIITVMIPRTEYRPGLRDDQR